MINKYIKFILKLELTPKWWYPVRFILHWISLPIKLIVIGSLGVFQIINQTLRFSNRVIASRLNEEQKRGIIRRVFTKLPIVRNMNEELYVNRVPYYQKPNGYNQNIDHQCSRHSTYTFLMSRIGKRNEAQETAVLKHINGETLYRGYNWAEDVNMDTVSGDMLCGLNLAMLDAVSSTKPGVINQGTTGDALKDAFDELVCGIIKNDYALLENPNKAPEAPSPENEAYNEELQRVKHRPKIKSTRGMWQPGLETVGAQAITLLAAVRVADKKCGSLTPAREYSKLLYRYGYGLLSLFPTAFIQHKRGYFNDHNCMIGLYVLAKLADSKLGKLFWTLPMIYVFLLSYRYRNGYFTGLLLDVAPWLSGMLSYHKQQCEDYLFESDNVIMYSREGGIEIPQAQELPVPFNEMNQSEFHPDQDQKHFTNNPGDVNMIRTDNYHSGLGWMAHMVMLNKELVRDALNE